jgi:hypothetical protein
VTELELARVEHTAIMQILTGPLERGELAPVERAAIKALRAVLDDHRPMPDDAHSSWIICGRCFDQWPCDVMATVLTAFGDGE